MATRDRTVLFVQYRSSFLGTAAGRRQGGAVVKTLSARGPAARMHDESTQGLMDGGDDTATDARPFAVDMSQLPPRWMDVVDEVEEDMTKIKELVTQVEGLHKKHMLPGFDDRLDDEQQIDHVSESVIAAFQQCGKKIKRVTELQASTATAQEQLVCRNVQTALATKLQELSTRFRKSQSAYLEKIRGRTARGKDLFGGFGETQPVGGKSSIGEEESASAEDHSFNLGFTEQQLGLVYQNEQAINQRDQAINDIVKSINGLAEIFRDMQTLVIDQGTILDRIDYNIEQVAVSMKTAHQELVVGEKYQKKAQSKYCVIALALLVVILLIILWLKPKRK